MRKMRGMRAVVAVAVAGVFLAGCQGRGGNGGVTPQPAASTSSAPADNGVAALSAAEILARAKAAVKKAGSFRVKGTVIDPDGSIAVDLKVRGADMIGSMTMGRAKIELLAVGARRFYRPNEAFWAEVGDPKKARTIAKLLGTRWIKVPPDERDIDDLFDVAKIDELLKPYGKASKGPATDVEGVPVIGLIDTGGDGGTLFVATAGEPYPLRADPADASVGKLTFSEFGATFADLKAPPEAQTVDLSTLSGS